MAGYRTQGFGRTPQRRPHRVYVVSHPAHDPGEDRRLRSLRAVAALRVTVDDCAEVWVNDAIPGRSGIHAWPASAAPYRRRDLTDIATVLSSLATHWKRNKKKTGPRGFIVPAGPPTKRDAPLFSRPGAGGHGC